MSAKMMPVLNITDGMIKSSTVAEPSGDDGTEWGAATPYAKGARVFRNHVRYESLQDNNTGNDPEESDSTFWTELTATKPLGCF